MLIETKRIRHKFYQLMKSSPLSALDLAIRIMYVSVKYYSVGAHDLRSWRILIFRNTLCHSVEYRSFRCDFDNSTLKGRFLQTILIQECICFSVSIFRRNLTKQRKTINHVHKFIIHISASMLYYFSVILSFSEILQPFNNLPSISIWSQVDRGHTIYIFHFTIG